MKIEYVDNKFVRIHCSCGTETYVQWSKKCVYPDLTYCDKFECLCCHKVFNNPKKFKQICLFEGDLM